MRAGDNFHHLSVGGLNVKRSEPAGKQKKKIFLSVVLLQTIHESVIPSVTGQFHGLTDEERSASRGRSRKRSVAKISTNAKKIL